MRASPVYWRVHVFGEGSAEALGETDVVVRTRGGKVGRREFPKIDSIRAELDAFADTAAGRGPYSITPVEMVNTVAAFEAINQCKPAGRFALIEPTHKENRALWPDFPYQL